MTPPRTPPPATAPTSSAAAQPAASWSNPSWTRRSYEAGVLLVPLDPRSRAGLRDLPPGALDGITVAPDTPPVPPAPSTDVPAPGGPEPAAPEPGTPGPGALEAAVRAADVLTLLADDLAAVDTAVVERVAAAARASGILLGAVIVSPDLTWRGEAAHRAATVLRENADTVLVLTGLPPAVAFLQVLRGGTRDPLPHPAPETGRA